MTAKRDPLMKYTKAELVTMVRQLSDAVQGVQAPEFALSARVTDVQHDRFGGATLTLEVSASIGDLMGYGIRDGAEVTLADSDSIAAIRSIMDIDVDDVPEVAA